MSDTEPSQKLRDLDFIIARIGLPAVVLGAVMWILWHDLGAFRSDVTWKLERSIRNERAIMQHLGIPLILDGDQKK